MKADEYQQKAARTLVDKPGFVISDKDLMIIWSAFGLAGEAGEVCEALKKGIFHQHGIDEEKVKKELGDVLWYVAAVCTTMGFSMSEIMESNIEKLMLRYPNGFTSADSRARVDVAGDER